MHEMSIAMAVVDQVEPAAHAGGATGVRSVVLEVGELVLHSPERMPERLV